MALGIKEFKKRFGKTAVDDVSAKSRYDEVFKTFGAKIGNGVTDPIAVDARKKVEKLVAAKDWHGAADILEEIAPQVATDAGKADDLRRRLKEQADRAIAPDTNKLAAPLAGLRDAVEQDIVADAYDEAESSLADFKKVVDQHLLDATDLADKAKQADGLQAQFEMRVKSGALDDNHKNAAKELTAFRSKLQTQLGRGELALAKNTWNSIEDLRDGVFAVQGTSLEGLRDLYDKRLVAAKDALDYWSPLAGDDEAAFAQQQPTLKQLKTNADNAATAYGEKRYADALASLDQAIAAVPGLTAAFKSINGSLGAAVAHMNKPVRDAITSGALSGTVKGVDVAELKKKIIARSVKGVNEKDYVSAARMIIGYRDDLALVYLELQAQLPPQNAPVTVNPKVATYQQLIMGKDRKQVAAALDAPDADLELFRQQPGAAKLLDGLVGEIGSKADSKEKKTFIQLAMKARFGLESITGGGDGKGMSTKALPRLYKLFAMLPASHTTDNDMITSVERLKEHDTSYHSAANKKILLKAGTSKREGGTFDDTTLHEIAHGVDAKFTFMETNGGAVKYGGWRDETLDSVKKVAAEGLGFVDHFTKKNVDAALLDKYITIVLNGGNPNTLQAQFKAVNGTGFASPDDIKKHPAVKHAIDKAKDCGVDSDKQRDLTKAARKMIKDAEPMKSILSKLVEAIAFGKKADDAIKELKASLAFAGTSPDDDTWKEMAVHPAVDFASAIRLSNGTSGLWDKGDSGATQYAVGGRVYQEAYPGNWISYQVAARGIKVCNYQFRHRLEWFAECYSRFFLGTLAQNHPLASWLKQQNNGVQPRK